MITIKGTKYENLLPKRKNNKFKEGRDYSKVLKYKGIKIPSHMDLTL
jgi:hypothetical protein